MTNAEDRDVIRKRFCDAIERHRKALARIEVRRYELESEIRRLVVAKKGASK